MKGLMLKDFYTLLKQMKIFFIAIIIFSLIPNYSFSSFAIIYASMLPVTTLAYDERSKWGILASTMPYTPKQLVTSKYILGYISVGCASVISIIIQNIMSAVKHIPNGYEQYVATYITLCISTAFLAITLPFIFKFGVEKGRIFFIILISAFMGIFFAVTSIFENGVSSLPTLQANLPLTMALITVATILINIISISISENIYKHKEI